MRFGVLFVVAAASAMSLAEVNVSYRLNALATEMCDQESRLRASKLIQACQPIPVELQKEIQFRNKSNATLLRSYMAKYGFPTISRVGKDGAHAAAVVAYHADYDRKFQLRFVKNLEAAYKKGEANAWDFAYMFDKMRIVCGRKQCFGTYFKLVDNCKVAPAPCEAMKAVNRRRLKMGMDTASQGLARAQALIDEGKWHQAQVWSIGGPLGNDGMWRQLQL